MIATTKWGRALASRLAELELAFQASGSWGHSEIRHYPSRVHRSLGGQYVVHQEFWQIVYVDRFGRTYQWGMVIGRTKAQAARFLLAHQRQWRKS